MVKKFVVNAESNQNLKSYDLSQFEIIFLQSGKVLVLASEMFDIMC